MRRVLFAAAAAGLGAGWAACIDQNPNCAGWAAAGECLANPGYMLSNCARACDSCDRASSAPADGAASAAAGGLSVQFVHALPGAGALEVSWVGDGRDARAEPTPLFTLGKEGEQSGVSTFLGHVFRVSDKASGREISRVRTLPGRDVVVVDARHAEMYDPANTEPRPRALSRILQNPREWSLPQVRPGEHRGVRRPVRELPAARAQRRVRERAGLDDHVLLARVRRVPPARSGGARRAGARSTRRG